MKWSFGINWTVILSKDAMSSSKLWLLLNYSVLSPYDGSISESELKCNFAATFPGFPCIVSLSSFLFPYSLICFCMTESSLSFWLELSSNAFWSTYLVNLLFPSFCSFLLVWGIGVFLQCRSVFRFRSISILSDGVIITLLLSCITWYCGFIVFISMGMRL